MQFLERLRQKPAHVRGRIAFTSALGATLLVALIWSTTLPARLGEMGTTLKEEGTEQTATVQNGFEDLLKDVGGDLIPEASEDKVPEESEVMQFKVNSLNNLSSSREENSTTTEPASGLGEEKVATSTQPEAPKETVILIGTTTKKTQ